MGAWQIIKTDSEDQPPEHDPAKPWAVIHPVGAAGQRRQITRFRTHAAALAFVLADSEVRRRTTRRKDPS